MKLGYLKQADVAREFAISPATVSNWLKSALKKENNLETINMNNTVQLVDSENNLNELERLSQVGRKYKKTSLYKRVKASNKFYNEFTNEEIAEIYKDLSLKRQIKVKYCYKNGGADFWNEYYKKNISQDQKSVSSLINVTIDEILYRLPKEKTIDFIDLGPGNGDPVKNILNSLFSQKFKINKYLGVDISDEINQITSARLKEWFPTMKQEFALVDFENYRLDKLLYENKIGSSDHINLILYIGNTICDNSDQLQVLKNLKNGMLANDLLVISFSLDTISTRSNIGFMRIPEVWQRHSWIPKELGIETEHCQYVVEYSNELGGRANFIVLNKDYEVELQIYDKTTTLEFQKGEKLCVSLNHPILVEDLIANLQSAGLDILSLKLDERKSNALIICSAK